MVPSTSPFYAFILAITVLFNAIPGLQAQAPSSDLFAVRVKDLTPGTRDGIALELGERGHANLLFACVPAGILVFEPKPTATRHDARSQTLSLLRTQARSRDITELPMSMEQAEQLCAAARNR